MFSYQQSGPQQGHRMLAQPQPTLVNYGVCSNTVMTTASPSRPQMVAVPAGASYNNAAGPSTVGAYSTSYSMTANYQNPTPQHGPVQQCGNALIYMYPNPAIPAPSMGYAQQQPVYTTFVAASSYPSASMDNSSYGYPLSDGSCSYPPRCAPINTSTSSCSSQSYGSVHAPLMHQVNYVVCNDGSTTTAHPMIPMHYATVQQQQQPLPHPHPAPAGHAHWPPPNACQPLSSAPHPFGSATTMVHHHQPNTTLSYSPAASMCSSSSRGPPIPFPSTGGDDDTIGALSSSHATLFSSYEDTSHTDDPQTALSSSSRNDFGHYHQEPTTSTSTSMMTNQQQQQFVSPCYHQLEVPDHHNSGPMDSATGDPRPFKLEDDDEESTIHMHGSRSGIVIPTSIVAASLIPRAAAAAL